jgi:hypothetical protein
MRGEDKKERLVQVKVYKSLEGRCHAVAQMPHVTPDEDVFRVRNQIKVKDRAVLPPLAL